MLSCFCPSLSEPLGPTSMKHHPQILTKRVAHYTDFGVKTQTLALSLHLLSQQVFIEHILCARYWTQPCKQRSKNKKYLFTALKLKQVQTKMLMSVEDRLADTVGKGEVGTNWENSTETYTLLYVKQTARGNLLPCRELTPSALWHLEGGME